jgi:hypothetical protein
MLHLRSILRPLAVALTLAFVAAPAVAFAGEGRAPAGARDEAKRDGKKHFPVSAEKFQKHVDKRIEKARAKLETRMKERNVPEDKRAAARKAFEESATQVRAAAKRVGQDGTVTKEEAKEVRDLAKSLKQKAREHRKGAKAEKRPGKQA